MTTSTTSTSEPVTETVSSTSINDNQQRVTETETMAVKETEKESLTEFIVTTESTPTAPNNIAIATVGKKIESIQSRRQKEDISSSNVINSTSSSFNPHLSSISAPAGPKDAASIATSTSSNNGTSEKRTMSYFLKDSGEGREMPGAQSSTVTSTSANSATTSDPAMSPSKTRRIVNLRNIKAPPRSSTTSTALAPQVRVVDGAIVYDEKFSAAINMNSNSTGSSYADLEQELEYIDEDDENGKHLTSATYSAKAKGSNRWNSNETDLFYEALSMCGTDFSMIQTLFPYRTRAQIKGKYKLEEKANPQRINDSLKSKKAFDPTFKDRVNELIKK